MKKKIELSIIHVALYIVAFLLVSGMLFYKSCLENNQIAEQIPAIEEKQQEKPTPKKEKTVPQKVIKNIEKEQEETPTPEVEVEEESKIEEIVAEEPRLLREKRDRIIRISPTKSIFNTSERTIIDVPEGKKYYESDSGILESLIVQNENEFSEILYARNSEGEEIDRLEIANMNTNQELFKYASIFHNKIHIFERKKNSQGKEEEIRTEYIITPDLRFIKGKNYSKLM